MATGQVISPKHANDVADLIAEEAGVPRSELYDISVFAELGIDDLMATSIIFRIREALKLDLPQAALKEHPNIEDLQNYIQTVTVQKTKTPPSRPTKPKVAFAADTRPPIKPAGPLSTLLQGNPKSAKKTIFLLPDGSGSGMSYARFPRISPDVCLIGMNSPFLQAAEAFTSTIEDLAPIWVQEIRQRQPRGPYVLGGWSAGGYYSFEVAKQLQWEGEMVEKLILIDSPCRLRFEPLPMEVIHYLSAKGLLGDWSSKKTPDWFVNHFQSTIDAVAKYMPTSMRGNGKIPEVYIIWAEDGALPNIDAVDTGLDLNVDITRFMLEDKKDFGLHGWDKLFPGVTVAITKVPGNHFTMVHPPNCNAFGTLFQDVLLDDASKRNNDWQVVNL